MARALKILVVVMGILLIGGMVALVITIMARAGHPKRGAAPDGEVAGPELRPGMGYHITENIPAGAKLMGVQPDGPRLVLILALPDGQQQLLIIEMASGARIGTVDLVPAIPTP